MHGFLRKVQTCLFLYDQLWNKSTNEITPLIDGTIRIATLVPFSIMLIIIILSAVFIIHLCVSSAIYAFYHKTFLDRSELTVRKSGLIKLIPFKRFMPSFLRAKGNWNWNTFLSIFSCIIRQYNLHSWQFVIKALLNSSKSLRLWNLWPITGPMLYQFVHNKIYAYGFLTSHTVFRK